VFVKTNVHITKTHAAGTSVQPEFEDSGLAAGRWDSSRDHRFFHPSGDPRNGGKKTWPPKNMV